MTIDEAIAHAREAAKKNREICRLKTIENAPSIFKCTEEYEHIAEWLEELKDLREMKETIECNSEVLEQQGYNKAIDTCIKEVEKEEKQHNHTITKDCLFWLKRKFEQLKESEAE